MHTALKTVRQEIADLGGVSTNALRQQAAAARTVKAEYDAVAASARAERSQVIANAAQETSIRRQGAQEAANYRQTMSLNLRLGQQNSQALIAQLRQEQATARTAVQEVNNYRIAWQRKANDDATTAALIRKMEVGILAQKNAIDAEITSLRSLGVLEEQDQARVNQLIAQRNTYNLALRTTSSVQLQIAGEIQKGSAAAAVAAGTTQSLVNQEKARFITKEQLIVKLKEESLALTTNYERLMLERTALAGLAAPSQLEVERLTLLTAQTNAYTGAIAANNTAQAAAQAALLKTSAMRQGAMAAGGSSKLNGAALGLSFVSPELGMAGMLLSMGPAVAGIAAGFLAVGGAIKTVTSGMNDFADWNRQMTQLQALTHMSGEGIQELSGFFRELSTEIPVSAKELGELGRQAVLVGLHGVDGIKAYTTSMSALSIVLRDANGESAGLEKVGQEIVKVLRSTGMTTEEVNANFATTVDTLVALKTQFGVQIPLVTSLSAYWSSYASSIGFSTTQIFAWSAALVSVGARAQGAGGALTKILEKASEAAATGGKEWKQWAQLVGLSSDAAKELLKNDPNAFLTAFATGMSNSSKSGKDMSMTLADLHLKTAQVVRTVSEMAVALPSMTRAQQAAADGARDHGLAMRTAQEAADNYKDRLIMLGHTWDNFKLSLGAAFTPMANDVVSYLDTVLKRLGAVADAWRGMPGGDKLAEWVKANKLDGKISDTDKAGVGKILSARDLAQGRLNEQVANPADNPKLSALIIAGYQKLIDGYNKQLDVAIKRYTSQATLPLPGPLFDKNGNPTSGQTYIGTQPYVAAQNGPSSTSGGQIVAGVDMLRQALGLTGDRTGTPFGEKYFGGKIHNGEDIFAPTGTAVNAPFTGWLTKRWSESLGNVVTMFDAAGNKFELGHLEKYGPGLIEAIDKTVDKRLMVQQGALIAYIGQTGNAAHKDLGPGNSHTHAMGWKADATAFDQMVSPFDVMYQGFNNPGAWSQKVAQPAAAPAYTGESQKELDRNMQTTQALMDKAGDKAGQYAGRLEHIRQAALNLAHAQSQGSDEWLKAMGTWSSANSAIEKLSGSTDKYIAKTGDLRKYGDAALILLKKQEAAVATGNPDASAAADRELAAWVGKSKVKQAVLDAEGAAYQTRKQNQQKADSDAAKAEQDRLTKVQQGAELTKATQAALDASQTELAQTRIDKVKANLAAQLTAQQDNAAARLNIQRNLGKQVLDLDDALALQLRDKAKGKADADAAVQMAALTKRYGEGKIPQTETKKVTMAQQNVRDAADLAYQNRVAANADEQAQAVLKAQQDLYKKQNQLHKQQEDAEKQAQTQLAGLTKEQQNALVTAEADKLKVMQTAQKTQLDAAQDSAEKRFKIVQDTAGKIKDQEITLAAVTRQAALNEAQAVHDAAITNIPANAKAGTKTALTNAADNLLKQANTKAEGDYTASLAASQQAFDDAIVNSNKTAIAERQKYNDAAKVLDIDTMTSTADRLKNLNQQTLDSVKDDLVTRARLSKQFADEEEKRAVAIAQAQHDHLKSLLDSADPNYGKAVKKLDNDLKTATSNADVARNKTVADSQDTVTQSVRSTRDSYKTLADTLREKILLGQVDQKTLDSTWTEMGKLQVATDKAGTSTNQYVVDAKNGVEALRQLAIDSAIQTGAFNDLDHSGQIVAAVQEDHNAAIQRAIDLMPLADDALAAYVTTLGEMEKAGTAAAGSVKAVTDEMKRQRDLRLQDEADADLGTNGDIGAAGDFSGVQDGARGLDGKIKPFESQVEKISDLLSQIPTGLDDLDNFEAGLEQMAINGQLTAKSLSALKAAIQGVRDAAGPFNPLRGDNLEGRGLAENVTPDAKTDAALGNVTDDQKAGLQEAITAAASDFLTDSLKHLVGSGKGNSPLAEMLKAELAARVDVDSLVQDIKDNPGDYQDGGHGNSKPSEDSPPDTLDFAGIMEGIRKNRLSRDEVMQLLSDPKGNFSKEQVDEAKAYLITSHQDLLDTQRARTAAHLEIQRQLGLVTERDYLSQKEALDVAAANSTFTKATAGLTSEEDRKSQIYIQAAVTRDQALTAIHEKGTADRKVLDKADALADQTRAAANKHADLETQYKGHLISQQSYLDQKKALDMQDARDAFKLAVTNHEDLMQAGKIFVDKKLQIDRQYNADTLALALSRTRTLEDIQAQSQQEQLDLRKQQGLDEVSYINARELLDIAAAKRTLDRAIKDGKDQVEAEAQYQAQLTGIQNKANADRLAADPLYNGVKGVFDKARTDQNNFFKGATSSKEYGAAMLENAAALEVFAKNLDKLGTPETKQAAEILRSFALGYKNLTPEVSKTTAALTKGLNILSDWAAAGSEVTGALGNLTGALGQTEQEYDSLTGKKLSTPWKDLTANLTGVGKAFNTLQTIAGDALAIITNPLDIKAWGKLFADVINSIADALAGFKKAQAEVLKNKADFAEANPLLNPGDYQKTYTKSRGFFADWFGGGPAVINDIDKIGLKVAQGLATGVFNGLDAAFKKYAETGNLDDFAKALTGSIVDAAKQAQIDAFKNDPNRQATFSNDIKLYSDADKAHDSAGMASALERLKIDARATTDEAKELLKTLDAIDKANGTGRYSPEAIAAQQRKVQSASLNNIQTALAIQNRAKLISDADYQARKRDASLAQADVDRQAALAAEGLTEQDRLNINEEFDLKRRGIEQDYLDWTVEAARKAADRARQIKLQALTNADDIASAQRGLSLAGVITDDEHPEIAAEARRRIDEQYESDRLSRALVRIETEREAAQSAADLTDEDRRSNDEQYDAQRRVAELNYSTFIAGQTQARADEARKALADIKSEQDGILNSWSGTFATAFTAGLDAANFDTFFNKFKADLTRATLEGTVAGLFKSMAEEELRPAVEKYRQALKTAGIQDDLAAIADIQAGIVSLGNNFHPVFDALQPFYAANNAELAANTAATKENTAAVQEQQFGTTLVNFTLPSSPGLGLIGMLPTL